MKKSFSLTKLSIIASCVLISATSMAAPHYKGEQSPCPDNRLILNGLYIGAQGGYDMYKMKSNFNIPAPAIVGDVSGSISQMADSGTGGLFIGYGMDFENFYRTYLGLEIFGNWMEKTTTFNRAANFVIDPVFPAGGTLISENVTATAKVRGNFGISVLPGIRLNDSTLLYARLGYNWARISINQTASINAFDENEVGSITFIGGAFGNISETKYTGGFNYGLGLETKLYQNLSGRIDYSYTSYSNLHGINSAHVQPSDNRVMLGLVYRGIEIY